MESSLIYLFGTHSSWIWSLKHVALYDHISSLQSLCSLPYKVLYNGTFVWQWDNLWESNFVFNAIYSKWLLEWSNYVISAFVGNSVIFLNFRFLLSLAYLFNNFMINVFFFKNKIKFLIVIIVIIIIALIINRLQLQLFQSIDDSTD